MISHISSGQILVSDQARALKFNTKNLGLELRSDQAMGPGVPSFLRPPRSSLTAGGPPSRIAGAIPWASMPTES
jgi:predicted enzyme related to lactoylglutathione lyase